MKKDIMDNQELIKAFETLGIPLDELVETDLEKGLSQGDYDKLGDEDKKGYTQKGETFHLIKAKEDLEEEKDPEKEGDDKEKEGDDSEKDDKDKDKVEKASNSDLLKAIGDLREESSNREDSLIEKAVAAVKDEFDTRLTDLEKSVSDMGEERPGKKSVVGTTFLEKGENGEIKDEEGHTVLSRIYHKAELEKAIDDLITDEEDEEISKAMQDELMILNTNPRGEATLSKGLTDRLLKDKNIIIK